MIKYDNGMGNELDNEEKENTICGNSFNDFCRRILFGYKYLLIWFQIISIGYVKGYK